MAVVKQAEGLHGRMLTVEQVGGAEMLTMPSIAIWGPRMGQQAIITLSREEAAELGRALVRLYGGGRL